jgi:hypothetical protein
VSHRAAQAGSGATARPPKAATDPQGRDFGAADYRDTLFVNWATVNSDAAAAAEIWQQENGQPEVHHFWCGRASKKFRYDYNPFAEAPIPEDLELEGCWHVNRVLTDVKRTKKQAKQLHKDLARIIKYIGPAEKAEIAESAKQTIAVIREIVAAL